MRVLPRPLVAQALSSPPLSQLLVTDVGYFPRASTPRAGPHARCRAAHRDRLRGRAGDLHAAVGRAPGPDAGQALVIPAGLPHRYEADADEPWTIWWMHLVGQQVPDAPGGDRRHAGPAGLRPRRPGARRLPDRHDHPAHGARRDDGHASWRRPVPRGTRWRSWRPTGARSAGSRSDPIEATIEHLRANVSTRISLADLAGHGRAERLALLGAVPARHGLRRPGVPDPPAHGHRARAPRHHRPARSRRWPPRSGSPTRSTSPASSAGSTA